MTTAYAYMLQSVWVTLLEQGNSDGRVDIDNYVSQVDRALRTASEHRDLSGLSDKSAVPTAELLIAGWSWRQLAFRIWLLQNNQHGELIKLEHTRGTAGVVFLGSGADEARRRWLTDVRSRRDPKIHHRQPIHPQWEPLGILVDIANDPDIDDVGGAPQVVIANQYGIAESFLIEWQRKGASPELWCGGRPLGQARSDLRALRLKREAGRFDVQPFIPAGLAPRDVEILRQRSPINEDDEVFSFDE